MLPFGAPPGFQSIMANSAAATQAAYLQQQVIMPPLQRILVPMIAVNAPPQAVASSSPRPMLVPPQMQLDITATPPHSSPSLANTPASEIWSEHTAADGRVYYYNKVTKQSSWQKPDELKTAEEKKTAAAKLWREYKTAEGRPYYYNIETKETTWVCPKNFDRSLATSSKAKNAVEAKPETLKAAPAIQETQSELEKAMLATLKTFDQPEKIEQADEGTDVSMTADDDEGDEADLKKKQVDKFRELLRDKYNDGKITCTCSWEQAVKFIQHDPRFRILSKVSEKKQLFNAWKVQRQKEERDEKRLAIKKAKEDLEEWLQNNPKVRPTMRYSKAEILFADEQVWRAVHDSVRKEIFRDALDLIDKRDKENAKNIRRRNVQALADILEGMEQITYKTTWAQAQRLLIENPSFANDSTLQNMDKEDALIVFEEHIRTAEKHYLKEKDMEERRRRRQERKIREEFQAYLVELHHRGELTSISLWSELYPVISADNRFDNMLKQSGSTPLDLFKFYVEDLKSQFGQDRKIIKEILKDLGFSVEIGTTFDKLVKWVSNDERGKNVDPGNMKLCYNSLVEKAEAKEKEQEREEARKRRRHETAFRNILRNLVPPVEPSSRWEVIRPKIENEEAFIAVETENLREKFFSDYIQNLAEACGHHHGATKKKKKDKKKRRKDEEGDMNADSRPKKKKKHHKSESDDEKNSDKKHKKKKKRSHSNADDLSNIASELSETELERKRKELITKLESSPQSS